ncbi:flavoprotein [Paenibacillus sp. XY044]|nr:flavoprotein [Paenibacillus sp. XY044]
MKITAISGSLRRQSSNTSLLHALIPLAPETMEISIFEGIGDMPHFNPDMDGDEPVPSVARFRDTIRQADGVIICTPEYAHGVPGVLKNALDCLVSSGEFVYKPVAVVSGSPIETGGEKAHQSLLMTLGMMTAELVEGGSFTVPFLNQKLRGGEMIDEELKERLKGMLGKLEEAVQLAAASGKDRFR